ncbi:MAG TPA: hypothetical protein VKE94_23845 [Gemmataceae bacterium]|nr:hypothetical protein [Gemmataceae bacterium]
MHELLVQRRGDSDMRCLAATDRQHLCGRIQPLDGEAIAQKRHKQATCPTRNFKGRAAIVTDAVMEKGLVPEGLVSEP